MTAEKLSISLDSELVESVRAAAAQDGMSLSTWLAEAALARVRQRDLRVALDGGDRGRPLSDAEIDALVAAARRGSRLVSGAGGAA
jgi:hypothetical protein